ncbi:MAG: hypothetical protein QM296_00315 [Bacillota bacterium]|nr:hypothetical protein [Bacillota bacterium]
MPIFRRPRHKPGLRRPGTLALVLALLLTLASSACDLLGTSKGDSDITTPASELSWPRYSFDELVQRADHILIANILDKGRPMPSRLLPEPFTHAIVCRVSVAEVLRVSDILFPDTLNSEYVEATTGSEQETQKRFTGLLPFVEIGQRYLLFLDENNLALSPDAVIPILDGKAQLPDRLRDATDTGHDIDETELIRRVRSSLERAALPSPSHYVRPARSTEAVVEEHGIPGEAALTESGSNDDNADDNADADSSPG